HGLKHSDVCRFVPGPDRLAPALGPVNLSQDFTKRQHAVIGTEIDSADGIGVADGPVMGVMEQQPEIGTLGADLVPAINQPVFVPFVYDRHVRVVGYYRQVQVVFVIGYAGELGIGLMELLEGSGAVSLHYIPAAPRDDVFMDGALM